MDYIKQKASAKKQVVLSQFPGFISHQRLETGSKDPTDNIVKIDIIQKEDVTSKYNMFQKKQSSVRMNGNTDM